MTPDLSAFGALRLIRPLPGGHRNTVWLVEGARGRAVAKSTRHGAEGIGWLAPLQMAARSAGFVVPHFHRTADGAILSNGWTVEDWCNGPAFAPTDLPTLAQRLAQFHRHAPALPQRPGARSLPDLARHPLPDLPQDIARLCHAALMPFADQPTQTIHGDITTANLIHTQTGPALPCWTGMRHGMTCPSLTRCTRAKPRQPKPAPILPMKSSLAGPSSPPMPNPARPVLPRFGLSYWNKYPRGVRGADSPPPPLMSGDHRAIFAHHGHNR